MDRPKQLKVLNTFIKKIYLFFSNDMNELTLNPGLPVIHFGL